ncbi:MAG TPA: hypothetical protein EYH30_01030 [Anaerolineales bacterium]|nr:hypothetical protein [Anaerolineales bacterium]
MPVVSGRVLKILAAVTWYAGGAVLLAKGSSLLIEADALAPGRAWQWLVPPVGLVVGGLKARFIFSKSCRENLDRIEGLDRPKVWQFFRPGFFAALAVMALGGATLSRLAHGNYPFLIGVAALDLSIATALLGSSYIFWIRRQE